MNFLVLFHTMPESSPFFTLVSGIAGVAAIAAGAGDSDNTASDPVDTPNRHSLEYDRARTFPLTATCD